MLFAEFCRLKSADKFKTLLQQQIQEPRKPLKDQPITADLMCQWWLDPLRRRPFINVSLWDGQTY